MSNYANESYSSATNRIIYCESMRRIAISVVSYQVGSWYLNGRLSDKDDWHKIGVTYQQDAAPAFFDVAPYNEVQVVSTVTATVNYKST